MNLLCFYQVNDVFKPKLLMDPSNILGVISIRQMTPVSLLSNHDIVIDLTQPLM